MILLQTQFGKGRRLAAESDGDPFVVCDHWKSVLPDQVLEAAHLVGFTAEVDFTVADTTPIEILTERPAVRATLSGEN